MPFTVLAGGPLYLTASGTASVWDNTEAISYHPESGSCGPFSNAEMLTKLEDDLAAWTDLTEVNLDFSQVTGEVTLMDSTSYTTFFYTGTSEESDLDKTVDLVNPIIFDDDAGITAEVAGEENQYLLLGFASPVGFSDDDSEITDGQAVINCRCLEGHDSGACLLDDESTVTYTEDQLDFTIVHEMGHFLNLDHTQVNIDLYDNGDDSDDSDIPIMFPVIPDTVDVLAARRDDLVALADMYPADEFAATGCVVTGDLLDAEGNELRCADVWAETDDLTDTVSTVSGTFAVTSDDNEDGDTTDSGECTSSCGFFSLFLETGKDFTLTVKPIESTFVGSSGMGPCRSSQLETIDLEDIATVSSAQCSGGTTLYLGEFTTTSTGGVGETTSGAGGGGESSGSDADDLNPVGYWCSLVVVESRPVRGHRGEILTLGLVMFGFWLKRRRFTTI